MALFYKELKELRDSRGISLEEIHDRTKINIKYLNGIENGNFEILPVPYVRLFLRAYTEEIGGNSQRALEQLDSFLGTNRPHIQLSPSVSDNQEDDIIAKDEIDADDQEFFSSSDKKLRHDMTKGGILLIVFIFAIIVFQKIFKEDDTAMATDNVPILTQRVQAISEIQLLTDFMLDKNDQRLLPVAPPFYVKLITMDQIAFTIRLDSAEIRSKFLQANDEYDFEGIENNTDFLFTDTKGLSIYINAHSLQNISNYEHPLKLTLKPNPPTMIVQWYKPLR